VGGLGSGSAHPLDSSSSSGSSMGVVELGAPLPTHPTWSVARVLGDGRVSPVSPQVCRVPGQFQTSCCRGSVLCDWDMRGASRAPGLLLVEQMQGPPFQQSSSTDTCVKRVRLGRVWGSRGPQGCKAWCAAVQHSTKVLVRGEAYGCGTGTGSCQPRSPVAAVGS
jgi:hypothetical protein